jgi:hypothetical protein
MTWAPDYATGEQLSSYVGVDDNRDDEAFGLAVTASSRAIDTRTRRQFGASAAGESRFFTARWSVKRRGYVVECDDFHALTEVTIDGTGDGTYSTTLDLAAAVKLPTNAAVKSRPWERLLIRGASTVATWPDGVRMVGTWGWEAVPDTIHQATLLQGSRLGARRNSPFGVAGSPDSGTEIRLLAKLDPDVQLMIENYRRRVWTG